MVCARWRRCGYSGKLTFERRGCSFLVELQHLKQQRQCRDERPGFARFATK